MDRLRAVGPTACVELLRSFAYEYAPNTWQVVVGGAMLAVIMFLPAGLWSLFQRWRRVA